MATADGAEVVRALPGVLATVNRVRQGRCAVVYRAGETATGST